MSIKLICDRFKQELCVRIGGVQGSSLGYLIFELTQALKRPFLVIAPSVEEAERIYKYLRFFLSSKTIVSPLDKQLFFIPTEPFLPYTGLSPRAEVLGRQFAALFGLLNADCPLVVTTPKGLMSRFLPKEIFNQRTQIYQRSEEMPRDAFIIFLQQLGYARVDLVEGSGEFSVRGEIIDIFCPLYPLPLRLEFFDDVLESVRLFNPVTQRSERHLEEFILIPAHPIPQDKASFKAAQDRLKELPLPVEVKQKILSLLEVPAHQPGLEDFFPLFYENTHTLFDYLPEDSLFVLIEPEAIEREAKELETRIKTHLEELEAQRQPCLPFSSICIAWQHIKGRIEKSKHLYFTNLPLQTEEKKPIIFSFKTPLPENAEKHTLLQQKLEEWHKMRFCVLLATFNSFAEKRWLGLLETWHLPVKIMSPPFKRQPGIFVYRGELDKGFLCENEGLVVLGHEDWQAKGEPFIASPKRDYKDLLPVSSFEDLKEGDYLVHIEHGIGRYLGLETITSGGITSEFLVLEYQDGDKLYLPVDKLHLVQRYKGVDEEKPPSLDKLGGHTFARTKQRVKKAVEKVAKELLELYAKRMAQPGYAFSPPDEMFNQLVLSFPYTETPDQQRAISEVIGDMLKPCPMDRLVCGDVGFGKTEVAVRAAFKAVLDGKQVAILVPTTILAEQHYLTFKARLEGLGVNIACLNRFRSVKEQKSILEGLKKGTIDIVVGTHRILQKDVVFKDLGLLIIDEEHRFGVRQKEHLKQFKTTVDVLTLSATPIPRTLYLSLLGVRDMSLIETPPPGRRPIKTYLAKFNPVLIKEAINQELARGGQVFFIHPRIRGLAGIARFLKRLLPAIRLGIAHGQMPEKELERIMLQFLHHELDVLLCTSIVESGLDIPNANTIIINRADMFGLAQLYHLRGRVGRSKQQGYAYLLVPASQLITKQAQKRLKALLEHSELSSGYKLALYDLKMRGAGNILGMAQSGHIAAVGYEMYLELLQKTVRALKEGEVAEEIEPEIKLRLTAYIPPRYIPDKTQRVVFYKRISQIRDEHELEEIREELLDRYGRLPPPVEELLRLMALKIWCRRLRIERLDVKDGYLRLLFSPDGVIPPKVMIKFITERPSYRFTPKGELLVPLKKEVPLVKAEKAISALSILLQKEKPDL